MTDYVIPDAELASLIQTELQQSQSWAGSEWRESIKQSLNYLLMRNKGDEVEGRSKIQSGDVADMLDHVHAELQPMYAGDDLVKVKSEGPQDEGQAQIESQALNWYWTERLRGFDLLDDAIQDGLLSRNGYLKVWYEESAGLPYEETIEGMAEQIDAAIAELSQENTVEVTDGDVIQEAVTTEVEALGPDGITSVYVEAEVSPAIYRATLKIIPQKKEVKGCSVAPEDMFITRDAIGSNMQQPRFVAQRRRMARQDVKALGFDHQQVDQLPTTSTYETDVKTSRKSDYNTYARQGAHPSGQTVDIFECYYRIDRDGDGIPELWKCFYGGQQHLLRMEGEDEAHCEMVRVRPFASGSPLKVAHRHDGRSLYDKEKTVEDAKRSLLRQLLDNLELGNDSGFVVGPSVEREDLEETDTVRYIRAGNTADLAPIPYTNTAPASLSGLQYMDKIRKERGGSSIEMSSESMPVNQAAHSTERVMSAMERLVAMYARNFANTLIRDTFVLLHQQMQLLPGKVAFEAGNQWRETSPRMWVQRNRLTVSLGESQGEKMRKSAALTQVIDIQREDGPRMLSTEEYEARVDFSRNAGLSDPQQYWLDPNSPEGQQKAQQLAQQAQQQQQMATAQQQMLVAAQMQVTRMQEETKRAAETIRAIQEDKDRLADMLKQAQDLAAKYVEMELKYATDVPGEGIEGGEVVQFNPQGGA